MLNVTFWPDKLNNQKIFNTFLGAYYMEASYPAKRVENCI